jgi:hypothetical protein
MKVNGAVRGVERISLAQDGQTASCCQHGNKMSVSIKYGENIFFG